MANYYRIRVASRDFPQSFFRVLLIKEDIPLARVGVIIASAVGASFEHMWLFADLDKQYLPEDWLEDYPPDKAVSFSKSYLKDLHLKKTALSSLNMTQGILGTLIAISATR
jgi:hypothetical protein